MERRFGIICIKEGELVKVKLNKNKDDPPFKGRYYVNGPTNFPKRKKQTKLKDDAAKRKQNVGGQKKRLFALFDEKVVHGDPDEMGLGSWSQTFGNGAST